jgi:hypothetical protein
MACGIEAEAKLKRMLGRALRVRGWESAPGGDAESAGMEHLSGGEAEKPRFSHFRVGISRVQSNTMGEMRIH